MSVTLIKLNTTNITHYHTLRDKFILTRYICHFCNVLELRQNLVAYKMPNLGHCYLIMT